MSDEQEGVTLKDLEFEAAGTEKAAAARDVFFRRTPTARRTREIQVSALSVSAAAAAGRFTGGRLIDRRPVRSEALRNALPDGGPVLAVRGPRLPDKPGLRHP